MLIDRYPHEDVFARVPELAEQTDPILVQIDRLLEDDQLYQQVHTDLAQRSPHTAGHGRHSTPAEVILRLLVVKHLYDRSYHDSHQTFEALFHLADLVGTQRFHRPGGETNPPPGLSSFRLGQDKPIPPMLKLHPHM